MVCLCSSRSDNFKWNALKFAKRVYVQQKKPVFSPTTQRTINSVCVPLHFNGSEWKSLELCVLNFVCFCK